MTTRLENEHYLRAHPEVSVMMSDFVRYNYILESTYIQYSITDILLYDVLHDIGKCCWGVHRRSENLPLVRHPSLSPFSHTSPLSLLHSLAHIHTPPLQYLSFLHSATEYFTDPKLSDKVKERCEERWSWIWNQTTFLIASATCYRMVVHCLPLYHTVHQLL